MAQSVIAVAKESALVIGGAHGTDSLYVSYDRGRSFNLLSGRAPFDTGDELEGGEIDERDSTLFVASQNGLWAYARPGAFKTPVEEKPRAAPGALTLESYPNPFRERATIKYELPRAGKVRVAVYDVLGRRVRTLVDARRSAGTNEVAFAADDLPAGVYVVRLQAGKRTATHRLTLVR
jgi:hypothetical protein